jgi:hypothetical protein
VAAIEERVALLEGRMLEQAQLLADIRETLRSLDQRLTGLERKVDTSVASLHQSIATVHQSQRREAAADFKWIVGIQVTTLIAVVAALLGALTVR